MNPFAAPSPAAGAPHAATDDGAQGGVAGHMAPQHCGPSWLGFAGHCLLHCHLYPTAGSADEAVAQRLQVGGLKLGSVLRPNGMFIARVRVHPPDAWVRMWCFVR